MLFFILAIESPEDRELFEQLYTEYRQLMFYTARRILSNSDDAEDAVQQAFVSILENLQKISQVRCPQTRAFCVLITEHKAIDMLRFRKHLSPVELEAAVRGVEMSLPGDGGLADAMAKLPARYRQILLLRYYMGYDTKELAQLLDRNRGAVQRLLWRAKDALRQQLEKDGISI